SKKQSVFSRLKALYSSNPLMAWAVGWVSFVPSFVSLIVLNTLSTDPSYLGQIYFSSAVFLVYFTVFTSLLMGFALLLTTFLPIFSGFVFGCLSLPVLGLCYTFATFIGYQVGKKLDKGSHRFLLANYPKDAQSITNKK